MVMTISYLNQNVINNPKYFNRKGAFIISCVVDVDNNEVVIIPVNQEHINIVSEYLRVDKIDIRDNPDIASHIVPFTLELDICDKRGFPWELKQLLIGVSGLEIGFRVRHTSSQIEKARNLIWKFLEYSEDIYIDIKRVNEVIKRKYQI